MNTIVKILHKNVFFISDEHYWHKNIIKYCSRPFKDINEMNEELIKRHNSKVNSKSIVVHLGDFCLASFSKAKKIINQLNGKHIFLKGSHDQWIKKINKLDKDKLYLDKANDLLVLDICGTIIVCCHYPMRVWPMSAHNSFHLYGHIHGRFDPIGKSMEVSVDVTNFYPVHFNEVIEFMKDRPNNLDYVIPSKPKFKDLNL